MQTEIRKCAHRRVTLLALGCCLLQAATAATSTGTGISVLSYGADPTGSQDSTAAIQAAANAADAANTTLYIPDGVFRVSSPIEIESSVEMSPATTLKASAAMSAVFRVGTTSAVSHAYMQGGIIEANNLAQEGIIFRQYSHIRVEDITVKNALVNGFHFGDSSITNTNYEAIASGLATMRDNGTLTSGSSGLYVDSNAVDGSYTQGVFAGSDFGIRVFTGGNFFTDVHVWSPPSAGIMTVGMDDNATGNFWKGCEADTAQTYGMRLHWFNTSVQGCRFYNNRGTGQDGVATGIYFDHAAPSATILGTLFFGGDSTHRLAADIVGPTSGLIVNGNQAINVVSTLIMPSNVTGDMTVHGALTATGTQSAGSFYAVAAPASSSLNTTTSMSLGSGWYDSKAGSAKSYSWSLAPSQTASGTPITADLFLFTKGTLPSGVNPRLILGAIAATSTAPQKPSTQEVFQASYYNGSGTAYDSWGVQTVLGTSNAPTSTLALTHWGSSGKASVAVPALSIASEMISASPRLTWTPYNTCYMGTVNCQESSLWTPGRAITLTQWTFTLGVAAAGCSKYPTLSLMQGSTVLATVPITAGAVNFVGGHSLALGVQSTNGPLSVKVSQAAAGCTTYPSGVSTTLEYVMQ